MKQTLIRKYLEGESSCSEERELKRLFQEIPAGQRNEEEQAILRLLSADALPEEEDIFDADFTAEYDRTVKRRRIFRLLPWTAACAASILTLFFIPHKPRPVQTLPQLPVTSSVEVVPTPPSQPTVETVTTAPSPQQVKNEKPKTVKAKANPPAGIEQDSPLYETPSPEEIAAVEQQLARVLEEREMMDDLINEVITNTYQQTYSNYTL